MVDVKFPVHGDPVPRNNAYLVFAGVSKVLGAHLPHEIGVFHLGGDLSNGRIILIRRSCLKFRCKPEFIPVLLPLIGNSVEIGGTTVALGSPSFETVRPAATMKARAVFFKDRLDRDSFQKHAQNDLKRRGIKGTVTVPNHRFDAIAHLPETRVVTIKEHRLVAFSVKVDGLSEKDATRLINEGMGSKRHMGCGLFSPVLEEE